MRKEADDVGPKAELDHWKKRMAKFNSLLDQIKGTECKAVVGVLHAAKSKLLKVCYLNNYILTYPHGPMEPVDSIHKLMPLYPGLGLLLSLTLGVLTLPSFVMRALVCFYPEDS